MIVAAIGIVRPSRPVGGRRWRGADGGGLAAMLTASSRAARGGCGR